MKNKSKIGRNDYCPCGSGLKFKKCHLLKPDTPLPANVPLPVLRELRRQKNAHQLEDKIRKRYLGEVRPIISCDAPFGKLVAVGSKIYKTATWADFHGFLLEHALHIIGEDWIKEEISANGAEHLICKWYVDTFCTKEEAEKSKNKKHNFSFRPLLSLAYDLFVLDDHIKLQADIVARLKHNDQFPGARYELFVAATCIRAGFSLEFEDEKDRTSRHVEFIARHKISGQEIHVEAKRSESSGHNYGKLINNALGKAGSSPLIVFVDVNKSPTIAQKYLNRKNHKIDQMLKTRLVKSEDNKDIFKLIIFTNHPYQYATEGEPYPEPISLIIESKNSSNEFEDKKVLNRLKVAISQYETIPKEFPAQT